MPKRTDIRSILIIGAGPIVIGQACEFDYSGTQACRALKAEGYRIILVNSNPATIMTDPDIADVTYIEPITEEFVTKIIEKEHPDALLPTMGGQTALNISIGLAKKGVLKKNNIALIGASIEAIEKAEDRWKFRQAMEKIGLECPRSQQVSTIEEAYKVLDDIPLPVIIRPSFTLGGKGGGIAYNIQEFEKIATSGLRASQNSTILIEESVLGWKEYEMEVIRDMADNCIIVCSIENIDPMGVHTGDSVTVAPALTLTDKEYQRMRNASIAVLREIGVDTGGSNVQFAVNPENGRMIVIEMNPRVSRSSALASKAVGFPIAKVAALLSVGYHLDELKNDITGTMPASFEPVIDYIVIKIPRFAFEKFSEAPRQLGTAMKSVGEVMAIGRNFSESLQKAYRSLELDFDGLNDLEIENAPDVDAICAALSQRRPERLRCIAQAFRHGLGVDVIYRACGIDKWFLCQIQEIVATEKRIKKEGLPQNIEALRALKAMGFSDARLAKLSGTEEETVRRLRHRLKLSPTYKCIDSCSAEFDARTPYFYSTYDTGLDPHIDHEPILTDGEKAVILGGGPNRIGQGIEFDYCCVHACFAVKEKGVEAVMINCNPETVSTDYDISDRLYFEPLTEEDVLEILAFEKRRGVLKGVIVQLGGQTPLKLSETLQKHGIPILGTSPNAIDLAEDRGRFGDILKKLGLRQPENGIAYSVEQAKATADKIGYPVLLRPSYVLGGRAMEIVYDQTKLEQYMVRAARVSGKHPVLIDAFLDGAIEIDVDALCDGKNVCIAGILEHIEHAGVHSGDSACSLPPYSIEDDFIEKIEEQTKKLALALNVVGLMNVQFAISENDVFVLEVNPRASRTVPFTAKALGVPLVKYATQITLGATLEELGLGERLWRKDRGFAVKESVFPFAQFSHSDTILGPEMRSTGEVMGQDSAFANAFAKAQIAAGITLPYQGGIYISVRDRDKSFMIDLARRLQNMGFHLMATRGTARFLTRHGITVEYVRKVLEGSPHVIDYMINGDIQLVINTIDGVSAAADSRHIRQAALLYTIPSYTTLTGAQAIVCALELHQKRLFQIEPIQAKMIL